MYRNELHCIHNSIYMNSYKTGAKWAFKVSENNEESFI